MAKKTSKKESVSSSPSAGVAADNGSLNPKNSHVLDSWRPISKTDQRRPFRIALAVVTFFAFALRFFRISHPAEVVFDEVHFGKFASHYLQREYYFDLHPPLAKMLFALVGYLIGYDGKFKFDSIGDSYITNKVPYIPYRMFAATLGSLTVSFSFLILESCGFSVLACVLGSCCVLFDSAQVAQSRLILLDAALMFFMTGSLLCYVRFRLQRHNPFTKWWWIWLSLTGFFLSCVISTKYVGLLTYVTVGCAVAADLYNLMDVRGKIPFENAAKSRSKVAAASPAVEIVTTSESSKSGKSSGTRTPKNAALASGKRQEQALPLKYVVKHLFARIYCLIVFPFILYLFWFYVHFNVLINSGPGNNHMSPEFQATLNENPVIKDALDVHFFDIVSIKSANSDIYLHSHLERYPLQYEDGRISSQGQQVTGYHIRDDPNSLWQILPPFKMSEEEAMHGAPIVGPQQVMLRHVGTDSYLLTHDVASPGFPTNEEFTTVPENLAYGDRHKDALFLLDLNGTPQDIYRTKMTQFRLKHVATNVAMWKSDKILPDWGFGQVEINGIKRIDAPGTAWVFDHIENVKDYPQLIQKRRTISTGEKLPRRSFFTDYWELQMRMFRANNQLTASHPYMSTPIDWPQMRRGISFWSSKKPGDQRQIYLVGNHVDWYTINLALVLFVMIFVLDQLAQLREVDFITSYARQKLNNTLLWLFLGYMFHYLPFFLMGRQLFLHHYLPAQVMGSMLIGGLADFFTGMCDARNLRYGVNLPLKLFVIVFLIILVAGFLFWSPLVYGFYMSGDAVRKHQLFNIELQFAKADLPASATES